MNPYTRALKEGFERAFSIAARARLKGFDPSLEIEAKPAGDLAMRVEGLLGYRGVEKLVRKHGKDVRALADELLEGVRNAGKAEKQELIERALRTCLAVVTEGVVAAPIEGVSKVEIRPNPDGSEYLSICYAGPIRSAGGTAQGLSVILADYMRRKAELQEFRPTEDEVERYVEEIKAYNDRAARLQYLPTEEELRTIVSNLPVCVDGEPTEEVEVSVHRDLPRIPTNRLRGGVCLVLAEGIAQKAKKLLKLAKEFGLDWSFLERVGAASSEKAERPTYLAEIVAGRPILALPSANGAFRLRYGRTRTTGIGAKALHPATLLLLDSFIAVGTQLKVQYPGKGCVVTTSDSIEGPVVKLEDGSVLRLESTEEALQLREKVREVLFLGDLLVSYGDFLQANQELLPAGYCEEWWVQEAGEKLHGLLSRHLGPEEAVELARLLNVPLHPRYTYHWEDLAAKDVLKLLNWLREGELRDGVLILPLDGWAEEKRALELFCVPHRVRGGEVVVEEWKPLLAQLGLEGLPKEDAKEDDVKGLRKLSRLKDGFDLVERVSLVKLRRKVGTYVGARMGRPEKAKEREMQPPVHLLFPLGEAGGVERSVVKAVEKGAIEVEVSRFKCKCGNVTPFPKCERCGSRTTLRGVCPTCGAERELRVCPRCGTVTRFWDERPVKLEELWRKAVERLRCSAEVKGVKGLISEAKVPEPIEKGILRAKCGVYVFKDGTSRFDVTNAPLTHFRPEEIGVSVEKLRELGYESDWRGEPLRSEDQLVQLKPQDVVLPEKCGEYLLKVARFVDELLVKLYSLEPFYKAQRKEDLIDHLIVGLAPHTSAAILGRIIGFTKASVCYAHPLWHAAKRRNCLTPDTSVLILNSDKPFNISLEDLYNKINSCEKIVDDFGTLMKDVKGIKTLALNLENYRVEVKSVKSIIRTPSPNHLVKIRTSSGREFIVSPEHRLLVYSKGRISFKKVIELDGTDRLMIPECVDFVDQDVEEIDLLMEFLDNNLCDDLMVRGIKSFVEGCVKWIGGLKKTSEKLNMNKKTFSNYIYRDSIPVTVLGQLLSLCGRDWSSVPVKCKLGVRGDDTSIPRFIKIDDKFMRLLGYYLAKGCARSIGKGSYQINFAAIEKEIVENIRECIRDVFGITPRIDRHTVTISSKIVCDLFFNILKTGSKAENKRIPHRFCLLPKHRIRELLRAYFSCGGLVEKNRLHVICSSTNKLLLRDIGLQLLRFGIFYCLKSEKKQASSAVKEFYKRVGENSNEVFEPHYISIRSSYARRFYENVGFLLKRKQMELESVLKKERKPKVGRFHNFILDRIKEIEPVTTESNFLYDIEVEGHHNFLINDFVFTANCDGDEDSIMLLLDTLINFSRSYLPEKRGGQMDAPLVINVNLDPKEVDDEAHKMEICEKYPLEFYEATWQKRSPGSVEGIQLVASVLEEEEPRICFTHPTSTLEGPVLSSKYKELRSMKEKVELQLSLARKLRACSEREVAELVVRSHFIRDTVGNLRAFSRQRFRCLSCNTIYRRVPLAGKCTSCGGKLVLTVPEGAVRKYLELSLELVRRYNLSPYLKQRLELLEREVDSIFTSETRKQQKLVDFLGE